MDSNETPTTKVSLMKKLNITEDEFVAKAKTVARFVVARSVSGIIVTAVHTHVPTETKAQKAQLYVGAYVMGGMVADKAKDWTDSRIDDMHSLYRAIRFGDEETSEEETTEE